MTEKTITRHDFKAAVEAGIAGAPGLKPEERADLRLVALTATEALVGAFHDNLGCGCPLTQAGYFKPNGGFQHLSDEDRVRLGRFYRGYDDSFPGLVLRVKVLD